MDMQAGFDFGMDLSQKFFEHAPGTWRNPEFSVEHYENILGAAPTYLMRIAGPARRLFQAAVDLAKITLANEAAYPYACRAFNLRQTVVDVSIDDIELFMAHCEAMRTNYFQGIQYKTRKPFDQQAGMYIDKVGSLVATKWRNKRPYNGGRYVLQFVPFRDLFFLDSYRDDQQSHELSQAIWGPTYAAQKLAEADTKIASVRTFDFNGRMYLQTGGCYHSEQAECNGWRLCSLDDWKGATYNYREHCKAWDDATLERGDLRGRIVRVKGRLYVLESPAKFYDDAANCIVTTDEDTEEK